MWQESTLAPYFESMASWGYEQLSPKVREWINQNLKGDKKSTNTAARPTAHDANSGVLHATPGVEEPSLNGLESTQ
jgi:hypothetical protein